MDIKEFAKKNKLWLIIGAAALVVIIAVIIIIVAVSGNKDGKIGKNPSLPAYSKSVPASAEALATTLEGEGYNAETVATGIVYGTKKSNGKDYEYYGIDTASSSTSNEYALAAGAFKEMFDSFKSLNNTNKKALEDALKEEGITNFNIGSDAMSWTDGEGSYSIAIRGNWILVEVAVTVGGGNVAGAPSAPQNLELEQLTTENGKVKFSWEAPASNASGIVKYEVMYYTTGGGGSEMNTWLSAGTDLEYTFTGCGSANNVTFYVRAVNASGNGEQASKPLFLYYVVPNAPTIDGVTYTGENAGKTASELSITWKYSDQFLDSDFPITKFQVLVYNCPTSGGEYTIAAPWKDVDFKITMVGDLKVYSVSPLNVSKNMWGWKVEIRACNANGEGAVSAAGFCHK